MKSPRTCWRTDPHPDRRLSRRSLLDWSRTVTFAAAAGLLTAWTAHNENASRGRLLFDDVCRSGPTRCLA